jgi:D-threo-aldose 1-dehydrogenase
MSFEIQTNNLGTTGIEVPNICFGTSALGSIPRVYGFAVEEDAALATLRTIFAGAVHWIDTASIYGNAEFWIGKVLKEIGGLPEGFFLTTKIDPSPENEGDYSGERAYRSIEESIERLGIDHFPLVFFHDPEKTDYAASLSAAGPVAALIDLKEQGVIDHIGVAGGPIPMLQDYVATGLFEVVISHNRYTLLDRSAEPLIGQCAKAGVGYINAAPFGSGMLAKGPSASANYAYKKAAPEVVAAASQIQQACAARSVPLGAAALQFSMRDPRVASTLIGITKSERVQQTLAWASREIPEDLWDELNSLTPPSAVWLG